MTGLVVTPSTCPVIGNQYSTRCNTESCFFSNHRTHRNPNYLRAKTWIISQDFPFTSHLVSLYIHVFVCMFVSTNLFNHRSEQDTGSHHTAPCRYWPHVAGWRKCGHLLGVAMCPHLAANYTNNALHSAVSTVCITDTGNNTSRGHVLLHVYIIYIITSTLHQTPDTRTRGNPESVINFIQYYALGHNHHHIKY